MIYKIKMSEQTNQKTTAVITHGSNGKSIFLPAAGLYRNTTFFFFLFV